MWWSKIPEAGESGDPAGFRDPGAAKPSVNEMECAWSLLDRVEQSSRFGGRTRLAALSEESARTLGASTAAGEGVRSPGTAPSTYVWNQLNRASPRLGEEDANRLARAEHRLRALLGTRRC